MRKIIVSSVGRVPFLLDSFHPDCLLSLAAKPKPSAYTAFRHVVLDFADIDEPNAMNLIYAATREHIEVIESLQDTDTLIINCQKGQRRSPTAALILLASLYPNHESLLAEWIQAEAPYVEFNRWMLSLASGDFSSVTAATRQRDPAPLGCYFELDLDSPRCPL